MGCQQTKVANSAESAPPPIAHLAVSAEDDSDIDMNRKTNGMDALPEPEAPPPTDPRLPLSTREVFRLKKSWKGIKREMEATGVEMFISLFRRNADLKGLFGNFKDLRIDDNSMRLSEMFEKHGALVIGILDQAITHIDNVDFVIHLLENTGRTHAKFAGFSPELFWRFEDAFLSGVKITLGDRYTEAMEEIYRKTIRFILQHMFYDPSSISQNVCNNK